MTPAHASGLAFTAADIYTPEQASHIEALRTEAALALSRVAMTHLFQDGPVVVDAKEVPPISTTERQPWFFRRRLIDYLVDRGDATRRDSMVRPTAELRARSGLSDEDYFGAPYSTHTWEAMSALVEIAGGVLSGQDGLTLLENSIGPERTWRIWDYLMVQAPPKMVCNTIVARTLNARLLRGEPTVVFEGGAGVGATLSTALAIDGFVARAQENLTHYGFTDISRTLMQRAREMVSREAPRLLDVMSFDRVDLDALDEVDDIPYLQPGVTDLVILESVLHDVANLADTLNSVRRALKPDGWLVFTLGARTRPGLFFPCELLQSTLHSYYRAQLDPPRRCNVGYLTIQEWELSLYEAGFEILQSCPVASRAEIWPYGGIIARPSAS